MYLIIYFLSKEGKFYSSNNRSIKSAIILHLLKLISNRKTKLQKKQNIRHLFNSVLYFVTTTKWMVDRMLVFLAACHCYIYVVTATMRSDKQVTRDRQISRENRNHCL